MSMLLVMENIVPLILQSKSMLRRRRDCRSPGDDALADLGPTPNVFSSFCLTALTLLENLSNSLGNRCLLRGYRVQSMADPRWLYGLHLTLMW